MGSLTGLPLLRFQLVSADGVHHPDEVDRRWQASRHTELRQRSRGGRVGAEYEERRRLLAPLLLMSGALGHALFFLSLLRPSLETLPPPSWSSLPTSTFDGLVKPPGKKNRRPSKSRGAAAAARNRPMRGPPAPRPVASSID